MKKNLFLLVFALTGWLANNAQVTQSYDLQTTTGTYNDVTDGTVVPATGQGEDFRERFTMEVEPFILKTLLVMDIKLDLISSLITSK
jgi:hypothetical protein